MPVKHASKIIQNVYCHMERNVNIDAMNTVSTKRVTKSTVVVYLAVKKGRNVMKVNIFDFFRNVIRINC